MSDGASVTRAFTLPVETMDRLTKFAAATNSPLDNAISRAINDGIDAAVVRWPNLKSSVDGQ